jgi:hypothetical protein
MTKWTEEMRERQRRYDAIRTNKDGLRDQLKAAIGKPGSSALREDILMLAQIEFNEQRRKFYNGKP